MVLTERDPNASGRTSRTSNTSAVSGLAHKHAIGAKSDISSAPGVMSMLKTSTEMGNIGGLTGDLSTITHVPRPPQRLRASSRLSTASSHSNHSSRTTSKHRNWPSSSAAHRSLTRDSVVPQYLPDTLSPTIVNIPGCSSLIPRSRDRDGHRSLSLTNTSEPTFRLSSNRSFASLRTGDPIQRPKSPYHYPTRLRRPGYRPSSPALSDITGSNPRRIHGHGSQGNLQRQEQMKRRMPSDISMYREDRGFPVFGQPSRNHSPAFAVGGRPDIPPVPPLLPCHVVRVQGRVAHKSAKGSISSGSTNQRTDSDAPSSDAPSPATPKDGASMEVLINPTTTRVMIDDATGLVKEEVLTGPLYYDYSEHFGTERYTGLDADAGLVRQIRTILEERVAAEQTPNGANSIPRSEKLDVAELPASPVPRRITRDLILAALKPASTTDDVDGSDRSSTHKSRNDNEDQGTFEGEDKIICSSPPEEAKSNRHSILSQVDTTILDSSTLNFAVRYTIPMVTEAEIDGEPRSEPAVEPTSGDGIGMSSGDDMSELLDGYQHTRSQQDSHGEVEDTPLSEQQNVVNDLSEKKSNHSQKPSDEQSFKSCTDQPERPSKEHVDIDQDAISSHAICASLARPRKDSDAPSFRTCKDKVSPDRVISMPPLRLPSTDRVVCEPPNARSVSEIVLARPHPTLARKYRIPLRDPGIAVSTEKPPAASDTSPKESVGTSSTSSSKENVLKPHQPPSVPPRESSSSKEAQRSSAVAGFLLRQFRHRRFTKAQPSSERKLPLDESTVRQRDQKNMTPSASSARSKTTSLPELPADPVQTPERALTKQEIVPQKQTTGPLTPKLQTPANALTIGTTSLTHGHSLSTPCVIPAPSSVYSPGSLSRSKSKSRVQSSPATIPKSPEASCRDSQTTTHLVWHGCNSVNLPRSNSSEPRLNSAHSQDETTTDLRLSTYKYPLHYLPDLKEESHEDSSLNTSASNLRNSNVRLPFSGLPTVPSIRTSADNAVLLSRNPSIRSHRQSGLSHSHGLPSMNFSRIDLIDKLNEVLDFRYSRSLDSASNGLFEGLDATGQRPTSAQEMREKYRSFFASLDELEKPRNVSNNAVLANLVHKKRTLPTKELMAEIDQLSIPSVGGLTQRISEFLPALKEYYNLDELENFFTEEVIMETALEEIHEVGGPAPKRSSARLRPMPGSPNMVVIDDAVYEEITSKEKGSLTPDSTAKTIESVVDDSSDATNRRSKSAALLNKKNSSSAVTPSPIFLRTRATTLDPQDFRARAESRLSRRRRSSQSALNTPTATDTRPWNSDKNYPWATDILSIDISLPSPRALKSSPRPGPSHLRNRLSDTSTASTLHIGLTPAGSPCAARGGAGDANPRRHSHRFGNLTRSSDQPHAAGERYPTSALVAPNVFIADPQSHFSGSDTSDDEVQAISRKSRFGIRSRFSSSCVAAPNGSPHAKSGKTHSMPTSPENMQSESLHHSTTSIQDCAGETRAFSAHRQTFQEAEGMPKAVYHRHRLIDHIKRWWHRGGDLIRSFSRRSRQSGGQV